MNLLPKGDTALSSFYTHFIIQAIRLSPDFCKLLKFYFLSFSFQEQLGVGMLRGSSGSSISIISKSPKTLSSLKPLEKVMK
jgi:hypothetical protein